MNRQERAAFKKDKLSNKAQVQKVITSASPISFCGKPSKDGSVFKFICPDNGFIRNPIVYIENFKSKDKDYSLVAKITRPDRTTVSFPIDNKSIETFEKANIPVVRGDRVHIHINSEDAKNKDIWIGFLYEAQ